MAYISAEGAVGTSVVSFNKKEMQGTHKGEDKLRRLATRPASSDNCYDFGCALFSSHDHDYSAHQMDKTRDFNWRFKWTSGSLATI